MMLHDIAAAREADLALIPRVYFFYCDGLVKIGTAVDVERRLESIRKGHGFTLHPDHIKPHRAQLIGSIVGGRRVESYLHKRNHGYRREGEWFLLTADIVADLELLLERPASEFIKRKWCVTSPDVALRLTGRRQRQAPSGPLAQRYAQSRPQAS